jgi:hypothetical protein
VTPKTRAAILGRRRPCKVVAENDDISPTNQNSRIVGTYTVTVREFAAKKN